MQHRKITESPFLTSKLLRTAHNIIKSLTRKFSSQLADPAVDAYPLMETPVTIMTLIFLYIMTVFQAGPK